MIAETARLSKLIPKTQLTTAILLGIILAVATQYILKKTIFGYEMDVNRSKYTCGADGRN